MIGVFNGISVGRPVIASETGENIVTDGLIFRVDAGDSASYPGTGTTWTDVINGNNGTILNGTAYNSAEGGYFDFDGVDDKVDFGQPAILESNKRNNKAVT
jgi:hypothetical protein